jgi:cell fate regulator YaaT (PSP1 superfamily)
MSRFVNVSIGHGPELTCSSPAELANHEGDACVIDGGGLQEYGHVVRLDPPVAANADQKRMPRVLRRATLQDQSKANENTLMSRMATKTSVALAEKRGIRLKLIQGRYSFDRSVFMILFTADERLDVKDLVRDLANELRARIDMKQIGVRDQAGIVGGIGLCGRLLCCGTWLHKFASINVKMAKVQGLSLNPSAIGGCCGRLKCCLSYEHDVYRECSRNLPETSARVECPEGKGIVMGKNILGERVKIRLDNDRVVECGKESVRELGSRTSKKRRADDEDSGGEWAESESPGEA